MIRYQTDDEGVVSQPEYTLTKPSNGPNDRDHLIATVRDRALIGEVPVYGFRWTWHWMLAIAVWVLAFGVPTSVASGTQAATLRDMTLSEVAAEAEVIAIVTVAAVEQTWDAEAGWPFTHVTLSDIEVLKGEVDGGNLTLRLLGGLKPGGLAVAVPGMPRPDARRGGGVRGRERPRAVVARRLVAGFYRVLRQSGVPTVVTRAGCRLTLDELRSALDGGLDVSGTTLLGVHGWVVDMSKSLLLLLAVTQCVETAAAAPPQQAETPAAATATRWRAWRAPRRYRCDAAVSGGRRVANGGDTAPRGGTLRRPRRPAIPRRARAGMGVPSDRRSSRKERVLGRLLPGFQPDHRLRTPRRRLDRGDAILGAVLLRHRSRPGGD